MRQLVQTFIVLILWALSNPVAEAAKKSPSRIAFMKPVRIISSQPAAGIGSGSNWSALASYKLACGESFRGVLIREQPPNTQKAGIEAATGTTAKIKGLTVEVAVVVDRSEAFCSSLPTEISFALPIRPGARVRPIKLREPKRVVLEEAMDVGIREHAVVLGWQSSCQTLAGVILKPLIENKIPKMEISLARLPKDDATPSSQAHCVREIRHTTISGVHLPVGSLTVAERPGKIETSYFTRLVSPRAVVRSTSGHLMVNWERNCRERYVGLLFIGPQGRDVAVVTAVMPSVACSGRKSIDEQSVLPGLMASKYHRLKPAAQTTLLAIGKKFDFNYAILAANSIDLVREGQGDQLTVSAQGLHCSEALGLLAGNDAYGNVAVGVMVGTPQSVCAINQIKYMRELRAPLVAPSRGAIPRVFGLRVFGTVLN